MQSEISLYNGFCRHFRSSASASSASVGYCAHLPVEYHAQGGSVVLRTLSAQVAVRKLSMDGAWITLSGSGFQSVMCAQRKSSCSVLICFRIHMLEAVGVGSVLVDFSM